MNLSKLTKQLKRDLKASPAKAAALVVLVVVAVVFWGPLVFKKEEPMKRKTASVAASAEAPQPAPSTGSAETQPPTWRELAQRLEQDDRMTVPDAAARSSDAASLNPFDVETVADRGAAEVDRLLDEAVDLGMLEEPEKNETPAAVEASLADCPLTLSSTLVGPKPKAVINGVPHGLGRRIGTWNGKPLKLERIAPRSAVVAWNGQVRELRVPAPGETPATSDEGERGADPPIR